MVTLPFFIFVNLFPMEENKKVKYLSKEEAQSRARKYCAYQERSHAEVRNKLLQWGQKGMALEEIMTKLIEENFLNEERFAKAYTGGKFRIKGWGRNKIVQQLHAKKISEYSINQALKEINEKDYKKTLKNLLEKKEKTLKGLTVFEKKNKLARFLAAKGYETELVWDKLNDLFDQ